MTPNHPAILYELFRCEVGSSAHGVNLPGKDDLDLMAIAVERPEYIFGVERFDQYIYRSAAEREGQPDAPSRPSDVDLTVYSLRRWAALAGKGNPSVLVMLSAPLVDLTYSHYAVRIRQQHHLFRSKSGGKQFLGYITAQRERMEGKRGGKSVNRQHLVEQYGFDTKYAMHMLRLGFQGIEYLRAGRFTMPMAEYHQSFLRSVRLGEVTQEECVAKSLEQEAELRTLLDSPDIPKTADWKGINKLLIDIYGPICFSYLFER